jgi:glutathione S-transferase
MPHLVLVIGSKRISSWSLRPWLALRQAGLRFEEVVIPLRRPETKSQILAFSPSGKLPLLKQGPLLVWDSLAICEFVAELACAYPLWPENRGARAVARAVSAEMHSGFQALRQNLPMEVGAHFPSFKPPEDAAQDIERILAIWRDCRAKFGAAGPFLFGAWTVADAMFAPVVFRFQSYDVALDPVSAAYCEAMLSLPAMREWAEAAALEPDAHRLNRSAIKSIS